jgi:hypothetical protein
MDGSAKRIRLWDKNFDLIAEWDHEEKVFVTVDEGSDRKSGPLHSINFG